MRMTMSSKRYLQPITRLLVLHKYQVPFLSLQPQLVTVFVSSGDAILAEKVMTRLGYSKSQIEIAGRDAYNYQGVGCPHGHAQLKQGRVE